MGFVSDIFGGLFGGGSDNSDTADKYAAQTGALANEQAATAKLLRERYTEKFVPVENQLISDTAVPVNQMPGYLGQVGQIKRQYANLGVNLGKSMSAKYSWGSGLSDAAARTNELNQGRDIAKSYGTWDAEKNNRMVNLANMGGNKLASAQAGTAQAAQATQGLTNTYAQAAQSEANAQGGTMGNLANMAMLMYLM